MKKTPKSKKKLRFQSPVEEHPFYHQSTEHHRHHPISSNRPRFLQKLLQLRKKETQVTPVPQKWIHNLTMEHKQKTESGQPLCSDVINTAQKLRKRFQTSMDCNSQNEHQFGMKNKTNENVELNSKRSIHRPFKFTITVNYFRWHLSN